MPSVFPVFALFPWQDLKPWLPLEGSTLRTAQSLRSIIAVLTANTIAKYYTIHFLLGYTKHPNKLLYSGTLCHANVSFLVIIFVFDDSFI